MVVFSFCLIQTYLGKSIITGKISRKTAVLHFNIKSVSRINQAKILSVSFSTSQGMYRERIFKFDKAYLISYSKQNSKVCGHFM